MPLALGFVGGSSLAWSVGEELGLLELAVADTVWKQQIKHRGTIEVKFETLYYRLNKILPAAQNLNH